MNDTDETATVHVVDDDDSFRSSMIRLLRSAGLQAIGHRGAGEFLIAYDSDAAGCMLLDITMPGPSGLDLLKALVGRDFTMPVIFVTGRDDVFTSVDAMKSGAFDYLVKPVGAERLLDTVHRALELDSQRRAVRRELQQLRRRYGLLTDRERAIFRGIMNDKLNKQLAVELGECERTVKAQRARMMKKLELSTLPELVRAARLLDANGEREAQERVLSSSARSAREAEAHGWRRSSAVDYRSA